MGNQALSGGVSAFLQSGLILKTIQRMFFVKVHVHCPGDPDWQQKHSSNVLENDSRSQNSAYTIIKSFIFHVCALFEQIPLSMNRDILKNPTWRGVKNSNKLCVLCHLVTWIPHTDPPVCPHQPTHPTTDIHQSNKLSFCWKIWLKIITFILAAFLVLLYWMVTIFTLSIGTLPLLTILVLKL